MAATLLCPVCSGSLRRPLAVDEPLFRCLGCGLIENLRSPDAQTEEARYHDVVFDSPLPIAREQWQLLESVRQRRRCAPGDLLDVGCGSGSFLLEVPDVWQCWGLDISLPCVLRARERLGVGPERIYHGHLAELSSARSFDWITFWDVFDHLEAPTEVLAQVVRLLKPGGRVLIRVRNGPMHAWLRRCEGLVRRYTELRRGQNYLGVVHRYGYRVEHLGRLLTRAGCVDVRVEPIQAWSRAHPRLQALARCLGWLGEGLRGLSLGRWQVSTSLMVSAQRPPV